MDSADNREMGEIPVRCRHCMRGESANRRKSVIGVIREGLAGFMMRKPGELLRYLKSLRISGC